MQSAKDLALIGALLVLTLLAIGAMGAFSSHAPGKLPYAAKAAAEMFVNSSTHNALMDPSKTVFYQGDAPDVGVRPMVLDGAENAPSVDGSEAGPRSMAMLSFNQSSPDCCPSTYSNDRGCVCMTPAQNELLAHRGQVSA